MNLLKYMVVPVDFFRFWAEFKDREFNFLDVGCGNHAPTRTKKWFSNCKYYGVDKCNFNNDDADFKVMEKFYKIDLTNNSLDELPDSHFDIVMIRQVLEHIPNGMDVIEKLSSKVADNGVFHIEFPGTSSLSGVRWRGLDFHFHADPSHIRIYDTREIANLLFENGFKVLHAGRRIDWRRKLILPLVLIAKIPALLFTGRITGAGLWSVWGHSQMIYARKTDAT